MYRNMVSALKQLWNRFLSEQDAVSTTEYAIMLALILLASITVIQMLGEDVKGFYDGLYDSLEEVE